MVWPISVLPLTPVLYARVLSVLPEREGLRRVWVLWVLRSEPEEVSGEGRLRLAESSWVAAPGAAVATARLRSSKNVGTV